MLNATAIRSQYHAKTSTPNRYTYASVLKTDDEPVLSSTNTAVSAVAIARCIISSGGLIQTVGHFTKGLTDVSKSMGIYSNLKYLEAPVRSLTADEHEVFQLAIFDSIEIVSQGRYAEI